MKKQILIQLAIISIFANCVLAQNWVETWNSETNFYKIQAEFNDYWKDKDVSVRGQGYKQFKRWEDFMAPRVYPSGDITLSGKTLGNYQEYLESSNYKVNTTNQIVSTTWVPKGPMGNPTGNATNGLPRKAGRLNFITFHPSIANTYWVGAADGGLWKTTDGGVTWTTNTDNLSVIGCNDLAIDPTNPNIMYLATGDGYGLRCKPSIGVLKSIDGGQTWNPTPLTFGLSSNTMIRRIVINPVNPQIVLASTNFGIYRTVNAGATWPTVPVQAGNIFDLEYKPGSADTVYAGGLSFRRSTDAGLTWTQISSGIPTNGSSRMELATTVANRNVVYVLSATNTTYGLQGVYRSTDGGTNFSTMFTTPNIIGQDCFTTTGNGGQGWYDLSFACSPFNASEVTMGALGAWKSTTNGSSWIGFGCAYNLSSPDPFIHADHHEFEYDAAGNLYSVNDGGICRYNGTQWIDITNPMNIAQIYKMGLSSLSPNKWISGHQDNGSNIFNNGVYSASLASDGMDCFIDRTNDQYMFASLPGGMMYNSTTGGASWAPCSNGMPGAGGWVTPWKQDPIVAATLYCGKTQMYKSIVSGNFWQQIGTMTGITAGQYIVEFAVAPSNTQYIYAIHGTSGIQVTSDGGLTWSQKTTAQGLPNLSATNIAVDPTNPQIAWVCYSGYSATQKVYKTINGGTSWSIVSANGLPNVPANCLLFEPGSSLGRIYIGMDIGVYYLDNTTGGAWVAYSNGLPNTIIKDLEISPASPTKLRAATFGRGVYEVDVVPASLPPVTAFNFSGNQCVTPTTLLMNDISSNAPNSWNWSVNPSTGVTISSSTSQNPSILFNSSGTYTISLTATNSFGTGNISTQVVSSGPPSIIATASSSTICVGQSVSLTASGANTYTWTPGNLTGSSINPSPAASQTYTVTGTNISGCVSTNTISVNVSACVGIMPYTNGAVNFSVFPNPTNDRLNISIQVEKSTDFDAEIIDVNGKMVLKQLLHFTPDRSEQRVNVAFLESGVYFLKICSGAVSSKAIKIIKE